jgi:hypothetical protein
MYTPNPHYRRALLGVTLTPIVCLALNVWVAILGFVGFATTSSSFFDAPFDEHVDHDAERFLNSFMTLARVAADLQKVGLAIVAGLVIAYGLDIARRRSLEVEAKAGWFVAILFGNVLGMLVYWYAVVRRDDRAASRAGATA